MRARRWIPVILMAAAGFPGTVLAQSADDLELDLFRPRLEISADTFPDRSFENADAEYGSDSFRLDTSIPLGGTHLKPEGRIGAYQNFIQARFAQSTATFTQNTPVADFPTDDRRLYAGGITFTSVMLARSKNLYLASAGASFAEDQDTLHNLSGRFFGAFIVGHTLGPKTSLIYGGAYTYLLGRGLPLPIFGALWRLSQKWNLTVMAPFSIVGTYKASRSVRIRLMTAPAGNRYRISNEGDFTGEPETLYMRIVPWRTTAGIDWTASPNFALVAQAGFQRVNRFEISNDPQGAEPFFDDRLQGNSPYARVAARFVFGKSVLDDWLRD